MTTVGGIVVSVDERLQLQVRSIADRRSEDFHC